MSPITSSIPLYCLFLIAAGSAFAQEQDQSSDQAEQPEKAQKEVEEMVILGTRKASYTEITENTQKLVEMPGSLGDPLAAITALPGVISPSDGGEPAVRGSSPSDNRYYIDGMPAGYIFHEFNTSIFDDNVVQDFQLFSAGFGAQYSGATGAIFDIRLRDPKNQEFQTKVSASLLRAGIFVESGVTDNSAFYLSARQGLIQYFLPEEDEANDEGFRIISAPEDHDYQFKYKWDVNDKHSLSLSLAGAGDFAEVEINDLADFVQENPDFAGDAKLDDRFDSQSINWEYYGSNGSNFRLTLANYIDKSKLFWGDGYTFQIDTGSKTLRSHYQFALGKKHSITVGAEYEDKTFDYGLDLVLFVCTEFDVDCQAGRREGIKDSRDISVAEESIYLIDNWQITSAINLELGIQRASSDYNDETFTHPRLAIEWDLNTNYSITAATGTYNRLPNLEYIIPEIGNPDLLSEEAEHFTVGLKSEIGAYWNWSVEFYHKNLSKQPLSIGEEEPDADLIYANDVEGQARGVDVMINKDLSNGWYGWLSLSYAKSERTNLRTQETRDYTFDTPLVINIVGSYQWSEKWTGSFRFTAKSGEATTEIVGIKPNPAYADRYLPVYGEPYSDRLPTYARLDLRVKQEFTMFGNDAAWFVDVINALNRRNISDVGLNYEKVNETGELHLEQAADIGIFPSVGISFSF